MGRRELADLITQYIDGFDEAAESASASADGRREVEAFFPVIRQLRETLLPVEPSPHFKDALKARLVAAWHEQRRDGSVRSDQQRREFFLRAAAVGSFVSVAALIAVVAHARSSQVHVRTT